MISYQTAEPGAPLVKVESETPVPQGTQVLIKTVACGVCHSDIHLHEGVFELGNDKRLEVGRPGQILGHEIFGEVVAVGADVEGVAIGDRRVVFPWIGCGDCASCLRGEGYLCSPGKALGIVDAGGFADHVMVPHSRYLFDKGGVSDSLAATYACSGLTAYSALKKVSDCGEGNELVIIGAGGLGMMALQIAQSVFNIQPIVVDIDEEKLAIARDMGAKQTFNSSDRLQVKELKKVTGGGAYAAIDFVGAEASVNFGLASLRKGGKLFIVGLFGGALNMPIPFIPMNARTIQGCYVGSLEDMTELMGFVREGKIAPIKIEERPLDGASQALSDLKAGKVSGRVVLTP